MKMQRKVLALSLPAFKWAGGAKNPGLKIHVEKVEKRIGVRLGSWKVGSIFDRGTEVCEELRKRQVDVCCLQEVRWKGEGARFFVSREEGTNYGGVEIMIRLEA